MKEQISCPGKINLFLDICAKKENGYHEILTLFLPVIGIEDTLTVSDADTLEIRCKNKTVPLDSRNLCWQAAQKFADAADLKPNWLIEIDKQLPIAGGMGGGSSNAGRLLSLLNSSYPEKVSKDEIKNIALSIGADVPFFLNPKPSVASGVGEELEVLEPAGKLPILLITFEFPISAAWAYQNRKRPFGSSEVSLEELKNYWQEGSIEKLIYNDLGFAVEEKFPIIKSALKDLKDAGALNAIVSGSGPTVFGVFKNEESRDNALKKLLTNGYPKESIISAFAG